MKVNGSAICIKRCGESIAICDNLYNFYLLNATKHNFTKSVSITKKAQPLHKYSKAISISEDGIVSLSLTSSSKIFLLDSKESFKNIKTLTWHKAGIFTTMFAHNDDYLLSGGEDGKCFVFKAPDFEPYAILEPRPDYISNFAFDKSKELIAISGFDKKCEIFDLESNKILASFDTSDTAEAVSILRNGNIFYVCKDGVSGIYSIEEKKKIKEEKNATEWVSGLCRLNESKYCALCTRSDTLYIMDTETNSILKTLKFENHGMATVNQIEDKLCIGFIDGTVLLINILENRDEFEAALDAVDIPKIYAISQKNIFLKTLPSFEEFTNKHWKKVLKEAIDLLAKDKIQEALQNVSLFIDDKTKKDEFDFYISQKASIAQFLDAIENKEYAEAYDLAHKYPEIKETTEYENLENTWRTAFANAKKLLYQDASMYKEAARKLLEPYMQVKTKKDVIGNLINNSDKYAMADKLMKEKAYAQFFLLCEKFTFLKDTDLYKKMLSFAEQLMDNINTLENSQNFQKATEYATLLSTFAPFKNLAKGRVKLIERKLQFIEITKKEDIKKAYSLVSEAPQLKSLNEFIEFNHKVKEIIDSAYQIALEGRSSVALEKLGEIAETEYWREKVCSIMKISYLKEIEQMSKSGEKDEIDWIKTLEQFINRYGKIDELQRVCNDNKLSGFFDSIKMKGDKEGYKSLPIAPSIIMRLKL